MSDGWQTTEVKDAIKALVSGSIGVTSTLTLEDDSVLNVRFRHENSGGAVKFNRLIQASAFEYHDCEIFLGRV